MNARLARLLPLCLLAAACASTPLGRKELAIQTALDAAFLACQTALNSPDVTWDVGAKEYCQAIVSKTGCAK